MATIGERGQRSKVSWTGKFKTVLQMFGIGFMVFEHQFSRSADIYEIGFALLVVAAVMTIWSMLDLFARRISIKIVSNCLTFAFNGSQ